MKSNDKKVSSCKTPNTKLASYVTAKTYGIKEYIWEITKTVFPNQWDLFIGDTGTSKFTINVDKIGNKIDGYIEGQVYVKNIGKNNTENLYISLNLYLKGKATPISINNIVDISAKPILTPCEWYCYDYKISIPSSSLFNKAIYKVVAKISITNSSYPTQRTSTCSSPLKFSTINDSITVQDINDYDGSTRYFNFSKCCTCASYDVTYGCPTTPGSNTYDNEATIVGTTTRASARVLVNCYGLEVTKTTDPSFTRLYNWIITKTSNTDNITLCVGDTATAEYSVTVNANTSDSNTGVSGIITIRNDSPLDATILSISDIISPGDIPATITCDIVLPYIISKNGGILNCSYTADLPNTTANLNTATVTIRNTNYDYNSVPSPGGTTDFTGTADIVFSTPTTEIDECINVTDTLQGDLGTVCYPDAPTTFEYTRQIGPYSQSGNYTVTNTATFTTSDLGNTGSSSRSINVNVKCCEPCNPCEPCKPCWPCYPCYPCNPCKYYEPCKPCYPCILCNSCNQCNSCNNSHDCDCAWKSCYNLIAKYNCDSFNDDSFNICYWIKHPSIVELFLPINLGKSSKEYPDSKYILVDDFETARGILTMNGYGSRSNGITNLYVQLLGAKLKIRKGFSSYKIDKFIREADMLLCKYNYLDWDNITKSQQRHIWKLATKLNRYNNDYIIQGNCP